MPTSPFDQLYKTMDKHPGLWKCGVYTWWTHSSAEAFITMVQRPNVASGVSPEPDSILREIGIYHWGDFNNSFGLAGIIDLKIFNTMLPVDSIAMKKASAVLAGMISCSVFAVIEKDDPKDIPFALLGAFTYVATRVSYLNEVMKNI